VSYSDITRLPILLATIYLYLVLLGIYRYSPVFPCYDTPVTLIPIPGAHMHVPGSGQCPGCTGECCVCIARRVLPSITPIPVYHHGGPSQYY
jgi:hypothetical protein